MSETSLMSINRYRLKHLVKQGHRGAIVTNQLLAQTDKLLGVILLCNNLANASAATLVTVITVQLFGEGEWALMLGTISVTLAILVCSEISPKIIAAAYAEKVGIFCSYLLYPLFKLLYPIVWLINAFVRGVFNLVGIKLNFGDDIQNLSNEEVQSIVSDHAHDMAKHNRDIVLNLFELESITVDDVMTAHTQVESINIDAPVEDILQQLENTQHTRFPVRTEDTAEIVGVLHLRKLLSHLREAARSNEPAKSFDQAALKNLMVEPYFIPSGTPIFQQIQEFQKNKRRIALIVDEYGDFKGIVTLEDILEEIIGDFTTHSPTKTNQFVQSNDGSWVVDGSNTIRELNKKLSLNLPSDGPKTLNGLIIEHFEDIPEASTSFKLGEHKLEILQTQGKGVKSVRILNE